MKKTFKATLLILTVIALTVSCIIGMTLVGSADNSEASLSVATTPKDSTYGYIQSYGAANVSTGNFADLAASLANCAPTSPTRYTLKLNGNVTINTPVVINTNQNTEVYIDLAGYTLTTATGEDAFVVNGEGIVRFVGNTGDNGVNGKIVYSQTAGSIIKASEGFTGRIFLKRLEINASGIKDSAAIDVFGGTLTAQNLDISYATAYSSTLISVSNAVAEIKTASITAMSSDGATNTAIKANNSDIFLDNTVISADLAIVSEGECDILLVDNDIEALTPFTLNSASHLYVLGGTTKATGDSFIAGDAILENVIFYYGTGNTVVIGGDPTSYGIQENCSFTESEGKWIMNAPAVDGEAMYITISLGQAPTVGYGTYGEALTQVGAKNYTSTSTEVSILTVLADCTIPSKVLFSGNYNEWVNVIISYNGKTISHNNTNSSTVYGGLYMRHDGADVNGNRAKLTFLHERNMYMRGRADSKLQGNCEFFYYRFGNVDIELAKFDIGNVAPVFCFQQGELDLYNSSIIASGVNFASTSLKVVNFITVGHSNDGNKSAKLYITNTTLGDSHALMDTTPIGVTSGAHAWIDGVTFSGTDKAITIDGADSFTCIKNSTISAEANAPIYGSAGTVHIVDSTVVATKDATISDGGVIPVVMYGTGKTEIVTGGAELQGKYTFENGYLLYMKENGNYGIKYAGNLIPASVKLPSIFANNMVLQRNKPINVYGYCDVVGATIQVTIGDVVSTGVVDENGRWEATFQPMDAAFGLTVEVVQLGDNVVENSIKFKNVNIGEVWVISGQSNANLATAYMEDIREVALLANSLKNVRLYKHSSGAQYEEDKMGRGVWHEGTEANVASELISAIGYATVAKLSAELKDVPVAVLHLTQGSTKIKTWVSAETLAEVSPSAYNEYLYWNGIKNLPSSKPHSSNAVGSVIYNNYIAHLEGFSVAGVLWYQGEGDVTGEYFSNTKPSGTLADGTVVEFAVPGEENSYTEYFYAIEKDFRAAFCDDDLPFYVMQIAPYVRAAEPVPELDAFKIEQYNMCKNGKNTYLVSVATDGSVLENSFFGVNDPDIGLNSIDAQGWIHPIRKSTVGIRAADMILANEYGIKYADVYTYPTPVKATKDGNVVTIEFDSELYIFYGDKVIGFELYDGSKWVKANGTIDGNKVILTADGVSNPTDVRYGCGEFVMELGDGTIIELTATNHSFTTSDSDMSRNKLTVTYNGKTYTIYIDTTEMIRTLEPGNITNASGVPMVIFAMAIEG